MMTEIVKTVTSKSNFWHLYIIMPHWYCWYYSCLQCFDAVGWAAKRHPACKKTQWWGAGVVICLERGADLHTAQLMPLPLTVSCFSKIQIGFTFLLPAHPGSPGQRAVKCVCVRVRACVRACVCVCVYHILLMNTGSVRTRTSTKLTEFLIYSVYSAAHQSHTSLTGFLSSRLNAIWNGSVSLTVGPV